MRSRKTAAALIAGSLAFGTAAAQAQDGMRSVDQFTCKDVMLSPEAGRDVAIAFLHGYLLGKSGNADFDIDTLSQQSDAFTDQCLDNPTKKAIEVMMTVKG